LTFGVNVPRAKLKAEGINVKFVRLDITNLETIVAAKNVIEKAEGRLDVLVNNAGMNSSLELPRQHLMVRPGVGLLDKPQNATSISLDVVREAFEPNLFGLIQTCTTLLPLLRVSPQAVILNVSTDMASNSHQAKPDSSLHFVAYNTSKAAANSYTIALASELRQEGIKVNAVTPGFTSTKLNFFQEGGKSIRAGAEVLLPWALLGKEGPTGKNIFKRRPNSLLTTSLDFTGLFIDEKGEELPW
jgi:NAD(P)-dependent dehydrogenase (short-subunit alcohol dehydrogenase family)